MTVTYFATPEQVAVAWLNTVSGVPSGKVATKLPGDTSTWSSTGFITVRSLGGAADPDLPRWQPAIQVDCWACSENSQKPPWGLAGHLAGVVLNAAQTATQPGFFTVLTDYHRVLLRSVIPLGMPRRIPGDEAGFARYELDLQLSYTLEVE